MKAALLSLLGLVGGFALGYLVTPVREAAAQAELPVKSARRMNEEVIRKGGPAALGEAAGALDAAAWPRFLQARMASPQDARLAARLWAEADPAAFWSWLREGRDTLMLDRFGRDLLVTWSKGDPDAAMDAALEITRRDYGDRLRRALVDQVLLRDLDKGLELAARAGDFNRFGWGERPWIERDPEAAVRGLAKLGVHCEYRYFLQIALPAWADRDPAAALEWLRAGRPAAKEQWDGGFRWYDKGYTAVAKHDPQGAFEAAREIEDPLLRDQAFAAVIASGKLSPDLMLSTFETLPLPARAQLGTTYEGSRETREGLLLAAQLFEKLPASRGNLSAIESLARDWVHVDREAGLAWARSLTDPVARRRALRGLGQ